MANQGQNNRESELQQLVERLQELPLETSQVMQRLTNIADTAPSVRTTEEGSSPPTPIPPRTSHFARDYQVGDKVSIENRITLTRFARATPQDRVGVVTRSIPRSNRVWLRTLNGQNTWRLPKNLWRLTEEECNSYQH